MNDLFIKAVAAYPAYCNDNGIIFQQPSSNESVIGDKYVRLCNLNGLLAIYVITSGEIKT